MVAAVIEVCAALLTFGVVLGVRWRATPYFELDVGTTTAAQRLLRALAIAMIAGLGSGILIVGAGARLAMRLLAVTAPPSAIGKVTEANEVVGRVTVDGTLGIFVFVGLGFGIASSLVYIVARRWLPDHAAQAGLLLGALLLLVPGRTLDPLRSENSDFRLVGPGWLAIVTFTALALLQGVVVAAFTARLSARVPPFGRSARSIAWHSPLVVLGAVPLLAAALVGISLVFELVSRVAPPVLTAARSKAVLYAGRVALFAVAVVAIPGFAATIRQIIEVSP